jgi:nucleoside phosphorylase
MRRVLLLAPMPNELAAVQRARRGTTLAGVDAARTGIGPDRALATARRLLADSEPDVDHVVISGIAGGLAPATSVGDLVVPASVVDGATGDRFAASPLGRVTPSGAIWTAGTDSYRDTDEDRARYLAAGAVAVDMETAAIARACAEAGVPWTAFRAISDVAGDTSVGPAVMDMVDGEGRIRPGPAVRFLVTHPSRIPRMLRLGRDASRAARTAAEAAVAALVG